MGFKKKVKNFSTITAPLEKMASDLLEYVSEQDDTIIDLNEQKEQLNRDIAFSTNEISKASNTAQNLANLISGGITPSE